MGGWAALGQCDLTRPPVLDATWLAQELPARPLCGGASVWPQIKPSSWLTRAFDPWSFHYRRFFPSFAVFLQTLKIMTLKHLQVIRRCGCQGK